MVVEPLEPVELFDWFVSFREALGMTVVPLGPEAGAVVAGALARHEVVCLLSDRDLGGDGIEVEFLGETTTLPAGPALLSRRARCPVLPTAVYFRPDGTHLGLVRPPLPDHHDLRLRADVAATTQDLADQLGSLIAKAPEQWHLLQPNWPSDEAWLRDRWP